MVLEGAPPRWHAIVLNSRSILVVCVICWVYFWEICIFEAETGKYGYAAWYSEAIFWISCLVWWRGARISNLFYCDKINLFILVCKGVNNFLVIVLGFCVIGFKKYNVNLWQMLMVNILCCSKITVQLHFSFKKSCFLWRDKLFSFLQYI